MISDARAVGASRPHLRSRSAHARSISSWDRRCGRRHAGAKRLALEQALVDRRHLPYGLFIWEVVRAHVAVSPRRPQTIHYRGQGEFMISGGTINRRRKFRPENL